VWNPTVASATRAKKEMPAMINPEELKQNEFLQNFDERHLNPIIRMARLKEYEPGSVVFRQGENVPYVYLVLSGKLGLQVEDLGDTPVEVSRVGPGELLAWSVVLGRHSMTATGRTVTRCRLAVLDIKELAELFEQEPRFEAVFLRRIASVVSDRLWDTRRGIARAVSHRPLVSACSEGSD
jgi:CRP-like cAMP-binding protein